MCPGPGKRPRTVAQFGIHFRTSSEYAIWVPSLASHSVGGPTLDREHAVEQDNILGLLMLYPRIGAGSPRLEDAVFYAHCVSYEHDAPAVVVARTRREPRRWGAPGRSGHKHADVARQVAELIQDARTGGGAVMFRKPAGTSDLPYRSMYLGKNAERVAIYSTALRQADPLSEFLHYFRVVESIDGGNGKQWLTVNLPVLPAHQFGAAIICEDHKPRVNVLRVYRRKALARLATLRRRLGSDAEVARHLYNVTRCGIAHGKSGVITYDFGRELEQLDRDALLLKMLARMAIDKSVPEGPWPVR